jgi:hypothetical protein
MPGTDRNITKSLMARLRALFQAPPAASGFSPFTVYGEDDLIAWNNKAPLPARPFVYLLDSYMRPKAPALPMIIVEVPLIRPIPFELGNRNGRTTHVTIHNFGRQRGERDDCVSLINDYIGMTFPVYQYVSGPNGDVGTFLENAEIDPTTISIQDWSRSESPDQIRESSVYLWKELHFSFRTKT